MPLRIRATLHVSGKLLSDPEVRNAIAHMQLGKTAPDVKRLFAKTVRGWHNKPDWLQHQEITANRIAIQVWAGGRNADQYQLVNFGSPAHPIRPINPGGFLRFQRGYHASTRPRVLSSRAYRRYGPFVSRRSVAHPGFEERAFDETIKEEYYDTFVQDMQNAINEAARRH